MWVNMKGFDGEEDWGGVSMQYPGAEPVLILSTIEELGWNGTIHQLHPES